MPPLSLQCTNEQKIPVAVNPTTAAGIVATLDGSVGVTIVSGEATVALTGPTTFELVSGANPGSTTFLVEADADLGAGIVLIQDTITLDITGALAVNLGLVARSPVPK